MKIFNSNPSKKYLIRLALFSMPLASILSSCGDDFLDAVPETSVFEGSNFDTPALVVAQVNGLYATLKHARILGGRYQIYNDVRTEEFVNRTSNGVTALPVYNFTVGADDSYIADLWTRGYSTINRANIFLKGLAENTDKVAAADATMYAAEAKFVRALAYFSMVQMFAKPYVADNGASPGLPLRLQAETSSANNALKRSSVAEVYTQILKDLDDAEAGLPGAYTGTAAAAGTLNTTRAHKSTAIALKSRVYLAMGRYANVITEANKIVSATAPFTAPATIGGVASVPHQLQPNIATVFTTFTTSESILSAPFTDTDAPGTQNQLGYYYNAGNVEYYLNATTGIYGNPQFTATDARKTALTGMSNIGSAAAPNNVPILTKWSAVSPYTSWVPLIRYSEVLLNLAEAEARVGDQARALALLLAVHHRSDPTWVYAPTSQDDLINTILTERRIELLGEGFRSNDLFRTGQPIMSRGAGSATALATIAPTDTRYLIPVPTTEILTNPAF
ncbi:RagB/SusD family nutrient uptake outer membrane protein [Rufibacter latericius]|uniref:RagB/SusD family nutrient uptake outer membrane protein n=1 Tax=Rufibacter latericius TaxID=2487040 RepID=A0A3M9MKZ6_9BACT|nr:RagB/SusD family nutrient uptake outer membrane protein [Rufibacter latericius]RNI26196.1 RagB/SusD family nutrient uptake outer membrane protein [Rufibacter latericius]